MQISMASVAEIKKSKSYGTKPVKTRRRDYVCFSRALENRGIGSRVIRKPSEIQKRVPIKKGMDCVNKSLERLVCFATSTVPDVSVSVEQIFGVIITENDSWSFAELEKGEPILSRSITCCFIHDQVRHDIGLPLGLSLNFQCRFSRVTRLINYDL
jgi:hypothetical protein